MSNELADEQQEQLVAAFAEAVARISASGRGPDTFREWMAGAVELVLTPDRLAVRPVAGDTRPAPSTGLYL